MIRWGELLQDSSAVRAISHLRLKSLSAKFRAAQCACLPRHLSSAAELWSSCPLATWRMQFLFQNECCSKSAPERKTYSVRTRTLHIHTLCSSLLWLDLWCNLEPRNLLAPTVPSCLIYKYIFISSAPAKHNYKQNLGLTSSFYVALITCFFFFFCTHRRMYNWWYIIIRKTFH